MKREIFQAFVLKFEAELAAMMESAKAAHEAATHEEYKAEDSHDTRGIEASYLAGAQAARAAELRNVILEYKALAAEGERHCATAAVGALVKVQPLLSEEDPKPRGTAISAVVAVRGGGTQVELDGITYSVFTPNSPIGEGILGAIPGEELVIESKGGNRAYRVVSVL
ncbi:MAG: hypothetical protein H7301_01335 [Cryobacterium sp.]|nr:hypothetical protein [Oligoflexia bacterium]